MAEIEQKDDARRQRQRQRVWQKTLQEYAEEISLLRQRPDYHESFAPFLDLVAEPWSPSALAARVGKPLAGVFCIHAPLEIFDALGLHAVKLCCGSQTAQRVSAPFMPVLMCPMLKSFVGMLDLTEEGLSAYKVTVLPTTCDWVVKLPEIMGIPADQLYYMELPHRKESERGQRRWHEEVFALAHHLEQVTGKRLTRDALMASIRKFMRLWALLDELTQAKRQGRLAPVWYMLLTNCFMLEDYDRWAQQVQTVLAALPEPPPSAESAKVYLAGSPIVFPNFKLVHLLEQAGMYVAADDLCSSERLLSGGVSITEPSVSGMLDALADRYHQACICPTFADNDRRINRLLRVAAESNIRGVVFNYLKGCHPYDIESITLEPKLKREGFKFIKIETDYGKEDSANILTRLEAFRQTLS